MQKTHTSSLVIGYLGLIQAASIPQLVNSPEAHKAATWCLLGCSGVFLVLMGSEIRRARCRTVPPPRPPRFWTASNLVLCFVFTACTMAAWKSGYASMLLTAAAVAVIGASVTLFGVNSAAWRKVLTDER